MPRHRAELDRALPTINAQVGAEKSLTSVIVPCCVLLALWRLQSRRGCRISEGPINLIVPYRLAPHTDLTGRAVAQYLKTEMSQPVVVAARCGGVLGAKEVAAAARTRYTLEFFDWISHGAIYSANTDQCCRL
jgi:tripartite-type tricarboxylate transporter receptor subunit TctC